MRIFYNYLTHQISHINGAPYRLQSVCYTLACIFYVILTQITHIPLISAIPDFNTIISLCIVSFICIVSMFYLHTLTSQFISERSTTRLGHYTSLLAVILLDTTQPQRTVIMKRMIDFLGDECLTDLFVSHFNRLLLSECSSEASKEDITFRFSYHSSRSSVDN